MGIFDGVKKYKFWLASFVLVFAFAGVAEAATLISPSKSDGSVVVSASDSFKNLYTAGANVTINGAVTGDLTAVGALVNLVGDVEQDVMLVGGTLNLSGKIGGDARLAGANITFTAPVGGDVVLAGGNVNFTEKAAVGGDLVLAGGNVYIDAPVNGHIKIVGGNININSQVAGDVEIISSKSLTFGPRAEVLGKISHKGPAEAVVEPGAKVSGIEYTKINTRGYRSGLMAIATIGFVVKFLALLIASWLLLYLRKHKVHQISDNVQAKPWNALGWGLVGVIVMPIVSVFLLLTFVGYYVGAIVLLFTILMFLIAGLLTSLLFGKIVLKYLNKSPQPAPDWQVVLVGAVIYHLLLFIPILGGLVIAIAFLMSVGGIFGQAKQSLKQE